MSAVADLLGILRRPVATNGKKPATPPPGIGELEDAIAKLQAERDTAEQAILAMPEQRDALLERDGTDDEIAELERATDRLHLRIERLDRIEPELFARLNALRDAARRAEWQDLRSRYVAAAELYYDALLALPPLLDAMGEITGAMLAGNFQLEAHARPAVPFVARPLAIEAYHMALGRYGELAMRTGVPETLPQMAYEAWIGAFGAGGPSKLEEAQSGGRHVASSLGGEPS